MKRKNVMKTEPTYNKALKELEKLAYEIESGKADPDTLSKKIRRSLELVAFCRNKLRETEDELEQFKGGAGD